MDTVYYRADVISHITRILDTQELDQNDHTFLTKIRDLHQEHIDARNNRIWCGLIVIYVLTTLLTIGGGSTWIFWVIARQSVYG